MCLIIFDKKNANRARIKKMYASDNNKYNDGLCVYTKFFFLVHWNVFKYFTNLRNGKYHDWKLFARKEI